MDEKRKQYLRNYRRRLYAHRQSNGLCVDCGAKKKKADGVRCRSCADLARDRQRRKLGWTARRVRSEPTAKWSRHSLREDA